MNKTTSTFIAAVAAFALSGGAYAQSHNTLATPSVVSPAAAAVSPAAVTSGYGTPGATRSDSGMSAGSANPGLQQTANTSAYGVNNTLATPSTMSPAGK